MTYLTSIRDALELLPVSFWVVLVFLVAGTWRAVVQFRSGLGLPLLAVLGTIAVWYVGDVLYNNYSSYHVRLFERDDLSAAWWQVALFLFALLVLIGPVHQWINRRFLNRQGRVYFMMETGQLPTNFEHRLRQFLGGCILVFVVLSTIAVIRLGEDAPYYFLPFLGRLADPWGRGQIGGGISALLSTAQYLQLFIAAMFGITAALVRNPWARGLALIGCLLTWPYFLLNRTRNLMIAVALPGILSWVFIRLRWSLWARVVVLGVFFLGFSAWFAFVIKHRTESTIVAALRAEEGAQNSEEATHHLGLNMYEELCWVNSFIREGTYKPNWGRRYFEELVNPIPRSLWRGKPLIGLDYAIARGQQYTESGTTATVSTGIVGQGVVSFGRWLGPPFAALLMSIWIALLARLDLEGERIGRLPLYAVGMVLTFNLGRDITFLTLYTFAFGWLIVWWLGRREAIALPRPAPRPVRQQQHTRPVRRVRRSQT